MTVTGSILQSLNNGSYLTDCLTGDILLLSLCNNSWAFGSGSNTASIMRINPDNVNINATSLTYTGNMGINQKFPQYPIDVVGDINFSGRLLSNGARFYSSPFMSNGTQAYTTCSVGIGTTTPSVALQIIGTTSTTNLSTGNIITSSTSQSNTLNIGTDSNTTTINIGNNNATVSLFGSFEYINATSVAVTDAAITLNNNGAAGSSGGAGIEINEASNVVGYMKLSSDRNSFLFKTPNSACNLTVNLSNNSVNFNNGAIYINSNNNIGIGTTSPAYNLHVIGTLNVSSNIQINGQNLQAGYWLANGGTVNYSYSNLVLGSNTSPTNPVLYIANKGNTNAGGSGDMTNTSSNIISYYDSNYSRFTHKSGNASIAAVYNFESNKNVFYGEATDSGFYSFRGRSVCINYISTGNGSYALDVNGSVNCATALNVTNSISLGTTNVSEKLTIASGNAALVFSGTYGNSTSIDQWISIGNRTQTAAPLYQQSNFGLTIVNSNDGCFFGLRNYSNRYDTVVAFGSDSNSRMRFVYANSNDYATILPSGNVGIGNTAPGFKLDVAGDVNFSGILRQNGAAYIGSQWSNTSTAVFLLSSNVGIGKTNPTQPLDVVGNINFTGALYQNGSPYIGSQWSNNGSNIFLLGSNVAVGTTSTVRSLQVAGDVQFDSNIYISRSLNLAGIKIGMNSNPGSVTNVTSVVTSIPGYTFATATSNVGINNASPVYKLDVAGDVRSTGNLWLTAGSNAGTAYIYPNPNTTAAGNLQLNVYGGTLTVNGPTNTSGYGISNLGMLSANAGFTTNTPSGYGYNWNVNGTTQMVMLSGGNVGIGSTTPSYAMDILTTTTTGLRATACNTGGYAPVHTLMNTGSNSPGVLSQFAPNVSSNWPSNGVNTFLGQSLTTGNTFQGIFNYYGNANASNNYTMGFFGGAGASATLSYNGNVGIGTGSPATKLDVNGTIKCTAFTGSGGNFFIDNAGTNGGQMIMGFNTGKPVNGGSTLQIYNNTTDKTMLLCCQTAGLSNGTNGVGILTGSPAYTLDVNGTARATSGFLGPWGNLLSTSYGVTLQNTYNGSQDCLSINVTGGTGVTTAMTCVRNVGVGINTTSPAYTLDVNGTLRATGTIDNTPYHVYSTGGTVGANGASGPNTVNVTWNNVSYSGFANPGSTFTTFTAPVTGLYNMNAANMQLGSGHTDYMYLYKGGSNVAYWYRPCLNSSATVDFSGTYNANLNQTVFANSGDTFAVVAHVDGSGQSAGTFNISSVAVFTVTLIQRTA